MYSSGDSLAEINAMINEVSGSQFQMHWRMLWFQSACVITPRKYLFISTMLMWLVSGVVVVVFFPSPSHSRKWQNIFWFTQYAQCQNVSIQNAMDTIYSVDRSIRLHDDLNCLCVVCHVTRLLSLVFIKWSRHSLLARLMVDERISALQSIWNSSSQWWYDLHLPRSTLSVNYWLFSLFLAVIIIVSRSFGHCIRAMRSQMWSLE